MRAGVEGAPTPHPVLATLPGIYQQPPGDGGLSFLERFCDALDAVLSPVVGTLDSFPAYLDVGTTPPDFLPWLAHWIGMPLGQGRSEEAYRQVLRTASADQGWQGTARGIAQVVESVCGCPTTVEDTGGATWTQDADEHPPAGQPSPGVLVRVRTQDGATVDPTKLEALVASLKPAHVAHRVEVVAAG